MAAITFIGTGIMGGPMARHLAAAGHQMRLYNRTRSKAETIARQIMDAGGKAEVFDSPAAAAQTSEIAISCVGNDDDLSAVILGKQGVFSTMAKGGLFIDHTTVSATIARQIAVEGGPHNIMCIDAPVSGGQVGAEKGKLSIMCGGSKDALSRAHPIMQSYAARIVHIGGPGSGQTTKMVNQICIAGLLGGLSEGLRFAQASNLDTDLVFEAISGGAAQSWQMDNRWKTMAEDSFDFGFAIDWMRKDLGLAIDESRNIGASLPIAALIDQFYAEVQQAGGGRLDTSALIKRMKRKS